MAKFGRPAITLNALALAIRMAPITIKKYFPDLDMLLFEILRRHIRKIHEALGQIPHDAPNRAAAKRAAYIKYTRTDMGALIPAHRLLISDRQALPPDLAKQRSEWRTPMGWMVGGDHWEVAVTLLDCEVLQGARRATLKARLFFFEKNNQKTFASAVADLTGQKRDSPNQGFLLLFLEKKAFPYSMHHSFHCLVSE